MAEAAYGSLPFAEQIAFFKRKLNLPTESWTDIYKSEHDWAFVVAGANRDALVADFRKAVERAIEDGVSLEKFRKDFDAVVVQHGWDYNGGRDWRSRVIYETNLNTSYAAGRYEQLQDAPYWQYQHADWVTHPRHQHLAWDGLVLARDDPFWNTHFPPNGWGCQCSVRGLWARGLKRLGKSGPDEAPEVQWVAREIGQNSASGPRVVRVPEGIDPGFEYVPGKAQRDAAQEAMAARAAPATNAPSAEPIEQIQRQRALGFPVGKGWELQPHELEFYTRFIALGGSVRLIQRSDTRLPTNDFLWEERGLEIEVKKPHKAHYATASNLIRTAVERARGHDFVKDRFIIDLGDKALTDKLRGQLAQYNVRNPGNQVRSLWVMSRGVLIEIELTEQK